MGSGGRFDFAELSKRLVGSRFGSRSHVDDRHGGVSVRRMLLLVRTVIVPHSSRFGSFRTVLLFLMRQSGQPQRVGLPGFEPGTS